MRSRTRTSKGKAPKKAVDHARALDLVLSRAIGAPHSSPGCQREDLSDAMVVKPEADTKESSQGTRPTDCGGTETSTPRSCVMVVFGKDWTSPRHESLPISSSPVILHKTQTSISPTPTSMQPPELKAKSTTSSGTANPLQPGQLSTTKRMSTPEADTSQKRTRPDPSQKPVPPPERQEAHEDDNGDGSETNTKALEQNDDEPPPTFLFACPYYRRNPVAYQQCLTFKLKRIRDVKQHLSRKHYGATCFCPTCFRTFPTIGMKDDHIHGGNCVPKPSQAIDNIDAVSPNAQELLRQRVDRNASSEDQWFAVYEILFGKSVGDRVDPYVRSVVRETLGMVRAFLRATGYRIIPKILESNPRPDTDASGFEKIIHHVFDQVETEFDSKITNSNNNTSEQRQNTRTSTLGSASSGTGTRGKAPSVPMVKPWEHTSTSEPDTLSRSPSRDGREVYQHSPVPMLQSHTFLGADDFSPAASSSSSDLSESWPSHFLPLDLPVNDNTQLGTFEPFPSFNGFYNGYRIQEPQEYPSHKPVAGFATVPPHYLTGTPTIYGPDGGMPTDYSWQANGVAFAGIGGGFHDSLSF